MAAMRMRQLLTIFSRTLGIMVPCKGLRTFCFLRRGRLLTMRAHVLRVVAVSLTTLWWVSGAVAAEPETRIVEAAARQDMATVRTLLKQRGVNVNAARADGVTA